MEQALFEKKGSYEKIRDQYESFKKAYDEKTKEMQKTSELVQALTTGISAEEGHESGYMEQLQGKNKLTVDTLPLLKYCVLL